MPPTNFLDALRKENRTAERWALVSRLDQELINLEVADAMLNGRFCRWQKKFFGKHEVYLFWVELDLGTFKFLVPKKFDTIVWIDFLLHGVPDRAAPVITS